MSASVPGAPYGFAEFDGKPASYVRLARELARRDREEHGPGALRVALVSTFTIDVLVPYLVVESSRRQVAVRPDVAPYGQIEQQLLDRESHVYGLGPDVVVIAWRLEDVAPTLVHRFVALARDRIEREIQELVSRIEALLCAVRERSGAHVLVWNFSWPGRLAGGLADPSLDPGQTQVIGELNKRVADACRTVSGAWIFDACRVATDVGLARWEDRKLAYLARVPFSLEAQIALAKRLARTLAALVIPPCKCLVVDLDNTLWGGVLGEDGIGGIELGEDYPGNVYKDFQRQLAGYLDRGVLLAIASHNNEADVAQLFERHGDMVLRFEDFAARQIHWNDKAGSLAAIAKELNIGTDALAFFDDSPAERAWVRTRMPEVRVIDVPADPLRYGEALEESGVLDGLVLTGDDRARTDRYREERRRRTLAMSSASVEEFIRSLDMRVHVAAVDAATIPRVVQLIGRTNQFNLTTRRHTSADVERMVTEGAIAVCVRVRDRFGDSGLVGVAIALPEGRDAFRLDTFLLSCRVLGRGVETGLLAGVVRRARARGAAKLHGEFVPTAKNRPAGTFLEAHQFQPGPEGLWTLWLETGDWQREFCYQLIDQDVVSVTT